MKRLLVLTEGYPSSNNLYNMSYVHSRNIQYLKKGIAVDVLSFSAEQYYEFENVKVNSVKQSLDLSCYDAVLSHAPNIRNHYRFILLNFFKIKTLCFFFHGHEILFQRNYYPGPYDWQKKNNYLKERALHGYDILKIRLIKSLLNHSKVKVIFVSEWMREEGFKCLGFKDINSISYEVINNPINESFSNAKYKYNSKNHKGDFITIRPLDGKKYAIDKVVELAKNNPSLIFHIYGKGKFFNNVEQPKNIIVFDTFIEQKNIPNLLNRYRVALMPTRLDAQGVMMCEMASYGIPIITSDLPVCREMLSKFSNCIFIKNSEFSRTDLTRLNFYPLDDHNVIGRFLPKITTEKELSFIFE